MKIVHNNPSEFGVPMKLIMLIKMCLNKIYREDYIPKSLKYFLLKNNQKHDYALLPLVLYFALEYTFRRILENQAELKLNGTHQLLDKADDIYHGITEIPQRKTGKL
jgi:hypothetical protein